MIKIAIIPFLLIIFIYDSLVCAGELLDGRYWCVSPSLDGYAEIKHVDKNTILLSTSFYSLVSQHTCGLGGDTVDEGIELTTDDQENYFYIDENLQKIVLIKIIVIDDSLIEFVNVNAKDYCGSRLTFSAHFASKNIEFYKEKIWNEEEAQRADLIRSSMSPKINYDIAVKFLIYDIGVLSKCNLSEFLDHIRNLNPLVYEKGGYIVVEFENVDALTDGTKKYKIAFVVAELGRYKSLIISRFFFNDVEYGENEKNYISSTICNIPPFSK